MNKLRIILFFLCIPILSPAQGEMENLGTSVNSSYAEVCPRISADGSILYFIRNDHPENTFGKERSQDIWYSKYDRVAQKWLNAKRMTYPFNQRQFNCVFGISPDGNTLLIKSAYKKGKYKGRGFSISHKTRNGWSLPEMIEMEDLDKMNAGVFEGAFLSNDGKTILMNFSEKEGDKNCDLYVSFLKQDGTWSRPLNLGTTINTPYTEITPFLASDGVTLYFASDRPGGYGETDIYKTRRLDDTWTNWSTPENIGPEINTEAKEADYSITADGKYAYMVSAKNSTGLTDIVRIPLTKKELQPDPVVIVYGKVLNSKTKEPINARIEYNTLADNKEAGISQSDPVTGEYKLVLPYGKNYGFLAHSNDYLSVAENIDLREIDEFKEIQKDLYLTPIEEGQIIRLNNLFFETNKATITQESTGELERILLVMQQNPKMEIELSGHTDNTGDKDFNTKLSEARASAVRDYLISKGIKPGRITAKGYADTLPVADNNTEEGKALNRRVEFKVLKK
ncbi:MAG TPA: OmpA family protein [Cytophagaceae bacterium]